MFFKLRQAVKDQIINLLNAKLFTINLIFIEAELRLAILFCPFSNTYLDILTLKKKIVL